MCQSIDIDYMLHAGVWGSETNNKTIRRQYAKLFPNSPLNNLTSPGLPCYRSNLAKMFKAISDDVTARTVAIIQEIETRYPDSV